MSERTLLVERLQRVLVALKRIPKRFAPIVTPSDFVNSESGLEHMDSICMVLIAVGEEFKKIDRDTDGTLFVQYPQVPWRGAMGLRDVLAHGYFYAIAHHHLSPIALPNQRDAPPHPQRPLPNPPSSPNAIATDDIPTKRDPITPLTSLLTL